MSTQQLHKWEPTGVTGYPITHPIVGQTDFYNKFKNWLPLMSGDQFAHVFAVVAPWGTGKSRAGYVEGGEKGKRYIISFKLQGDFFYKTSSLHTSTPRIYILRSEMS